MAVEGFSVHEQVGGQDGGQKVSKIDWMDDPNFVFINDPNAYAMYDKMVEVMRKADSLYWESAWQMEVGGKIVLSCGYTIWLKKPNYFRVETQRTKDQKGGTLIGDGDYGWMYWPKELSPARQENLEYEVYRKIRTRLGLHSIGHQVAYLKVRLGLLPIDPSTFHGYTDSLQPYIDGVRRVGVEKMGGELCEIIEVSLMKRQRSKYLWLSRQDHLPRKIRDVVRLSQDVIQREVWSNVTLNAEIPSEKFVWTPPANWQQWRPKDLEVELLKPGLEAPDFEFVSAAGDKIRLSGYRGKVVWLYIWRAG